MAHVSDFTKPQKEIVVDLINFTNTSNIAPNSINLTDLTKFEITQPDHRVAVTVQPVPGSGYAGEVEVVYERLDIQAFSDIYVPEGFILLPHGEAETLVDLLPQINAQLGIYLTPSDVVDKPIEGWSGTPGSFLDIGLEMVVTSWVYSGELALRIDDNDIPLSSVLTVTVLDGLNLPVTEDVTSGLRGTAVGPGELNFQDLKDSTGPIRIHWGDGTITTVGQDDGYLAHTYEAGTYSWHIEGIENLNPDASPMQISGPALVSITNWADFPAHGGRGIRLFNAANLIAVPTTLYRGVTDLSLAFTACSKFNQDLSGWDLSSVTITTSMFAAASAFNQDISMWDTGSVINMTGMFNSASSFNQDLSGWNVASVLNSTSFDANASAWVLPKPNFPVVP